MQIMKNSGYTKEDAYNTLNTVNEWIKNSDIKTSILITLVSALTSVTLFLAPKIENYINFKANLFMSIVFLFLGILYICLVCSTFTFCVLSLVARVNFAKNSDKSLFYFGSIAKLNKDEFIEKTSSLNNEEIIKELKSQIVINSKIAKNKFKYFNYGLFSMIGLITCIILLFVLQMF